MKNSIETIWKEGFLNEKSLIAPKINDLYNQKSRHLVDSLRRVFRLNLVIIIALSMALPVVYYLLDALWQGVAASLLLLLTAWYGNRQMRGIKTLEQGATSLDYLKSFDRWLTDVTSRSGKVVRFTYPIYFLIAVSTVWSTWSKQQTPLPKTHQKFPDPVFLIVVGIATLLMAWFSDKIYKLDMRLMYGRVFDKLKKTIAEMETLKQE